MDQGIFMGILNFCQIYDALHLFTAARHGRSRVLGITLVLMEVQFKEISG